MKLLMLGDSIRMGSQPVVAEAIGDGWKVAGPAGNCGHTRRHLEELDNWLTECGLGDVIHINAGLHDLKIEHESGDYQVPLAEYRENVATILARLREKAPQARIIWAATTPVIDQRHNANKPFDRHDAEVIAYNAAARETAEAAGCEINDLYAVIDSAGREQCIVADGVHMTDKGNQALAGAIIAAVTVE